MGWKVIFKIYVAGFSYSPKLGVVLSCNVYFNSSITYGLMTVLTFPS